jgi:hypothetical protein
MAPVRKNLFCDLLSQYLLAETTPSVAFGSFEYCAGKYQSLSILQEMIRQEFSLQSALKREYLDTETR